MEPTADIALIGLAVMGQNLILNMSDHGYKVVAYNRTVSKVDDFLNEAAKGHQNVIGAHSIEELIGLLKRPRKIMLAEYSISPWPSCCSARIRNPGTQGAEMHHPGPGDGPAGDIFPKP